MYDNSVRFLRKFILRCRATFFQKNAFRKVGHIYVTFRIVICSISVVQQMLCPKDILDSTMFKSYTSAISGLWSLRVM